MVKKDPLDHTYFDGCVFEYSCYLQPGTYYYYFNCSDGRYFNSTQTYMGLNVIEVNDFSPILSEGRVIPEIGYEMDGDFAFSVNYTTKQY